MANIIKKPLAQNDLIEIWHYIADDNPERADKFLDTIGQKLNTLAENPNIGKPRDEIRPSLRSFPVGNYIIFYFPIENGVEIIRVLSAARDIDTLFNS